MPRVRVGFVDLKAERTRKAVVCHCYRHNLCFVLFFVFVLMLFWLFNHNHLCLKLVSFHRHQHLHDNGAKVDFEELGFLWHIKDFEARNAASLNPKSHFI